MSKNGKLGSEGLVLLSPLSGSSPGFIPDLGQTKEVRLPIGISVVNPTLFTLPRWSFGVVLGFALCLV